MAKDLGDDHSFKGDCRSANFLHHFEVLELLDLRNIVESKLDLQIHEDHIVLDVLQGLLPEGMRQKDLVGDRHNRAHNDHYLLVNQKVVESRDDKPSQDSEVTLVADGAQQSEHPNHAFILSTLLLPQDFHVLGLFEHAQDLRLKSPINFRFLVRFLGSLLRGNLSDRLVIALLSCKSGLSAVEMVACKE